MVGSARLFERPRAGCAFDVILSTASSVALRMHFKAAAAGCALHWQFQLAGDQLTVRVIPSPSRGPGRNLAPSLGHRPVPQSDSTHANWQAGPGGRVRAKVRSSCSPPRLRKKKVEVDPGPMRGRQRSAAHCGGLSASEPATRRPRGPRRPARGRAGASGVAIPGRGRRLGSCQWRPSPHAVTPLADSGSESELGALG